MNMNVYRFPRRFSCGYYTVPASIGNNNSESFRTLESLVENEQPVRHKAASSEIGFQPRLFFKRGAQSAANHVSIPASLFD